MRPNASEADKKRFANVNAAYSVLSDSKKREMYDRFGKEGADAADHMDASQMPGGGPGGGFPFDLSDVMSELFDMKGGTDDGFSPFGRRGRRRGAGSAARRGSDIQIGLQLSFREAAMGCSKDIVYPTYSACGACNGFGTKNGKKPPVCKACGGSGERVQDHGILQIRAECPTCAGTGRAVASRSDTCPKCRGEGRIRESRKVPISIPPGVDTGTTLRVPGLGESGARGAEAGQLYVKLSVASDPVFRREGANLHTDLDVPLSVAILGGALSVPTLANKGATASVTIRIQPGTQPSDRAVLRRHGIRKLHGSGVGDQFIHFRVRVPKRLTASQREAITEFARDEPGAVAALGSAPKSQPDDPPRDGAGDDSGFLHRTLERTRAFLAGHTANQPPKPDTPPTGTGT